jgi:serine O-acetyltransferase
VTSDREKSSGIAGSDRSLLRWRSLAEAIRRDAARYASLGGWSRNAGFYVGVTYRLGAWGGALPLPLRIPALALYRLVNALWTVGLNVHVPYKARIGPGLCLIHPRNILVPWAGEIGENCLIFHEVTIGTSPNPPGVPKIGSDVDIYVGARVLGGITIGDGVKIGANCVVDCNVPAESVIVPARPRIVPGALVAVFGPPRPERATGTPGGGSKP